MKDRVTQKRLIHTFNGHNKAIHSIQAFKDYPSIFLSASHDGSARIWSLETFTHLYTLEIPGVINYVKILQGSQFVISQTEEDVNVYRLHYILQNYMRTESKVTKISPGFLNVKDMDAGNVAFTIALCKDNSAFIKDIKQGKDDVKTTLYPPPSAQLIQKIVYSARLDRFIILLSSSTICIFKRFKETALLEKIQDPGEVKDSENKKALTQTVTCMELI